MLTGVPTAAEPGALTRNLTFVPFSTAANGAMPVPPLLMATLASPTATHADNGQDTADREEVIAPDGSSPVVVAHVPPVVSVSTRLWVTAVASRNEPTAVHAVAEAHDTPRRLEDGSPVTGSVSAQWGTVPP